MTTSNNTAALAAVETSVMDMNQGGSAQMAAVLQDMEAKLNLVKAFFQRVMVKELDYGIIPGTDKPSLLKPGAEKLLALYNFSSVVKEKNEIRDLKTGYYQAQLVIQIIHRGSGTIVAEGVGEASSYESKYRYRWVYESDVPEGIDKSSLMSKTFKSKNNGKEYKKYRLENPDLIDQWNTVLKMAKKRALVDAALTSTGTSSIFSQSEDEWSAWIEEDGRPEKMEKVRSTPRANDEKGSFTPPTAGNGAISEAQIRKIIGDAGRKGISAEAIRIIVQYVKGVELEQLSKPDASAMIEFISKTSQEQLQELQVEAMGLGGDD